MNNFNPFDNSPEAIAFRLLVLGAVCATAVAVIMPISLQSGILLMVAGLALCCFMVGQHLMSYLD